jgi:exo-beta-1,3-glucanase (GH17 family)
MGGVHGVCYGVLGDNLPSRADVVQLYKSNNIQAMRIYFPDQAALAALRGSGIVVILDVGGVDAVRALAGSASAAADWVQANVQAYQRDVLIRYIAVGNEVGPGDGAAGLLLPAMRNVHAALVSAGLDGSVKVSTAVKMDAFADTFPPSRGVFAQVYMADVARFLADTGAPLLANVYPYFAYRDDPRSISLEFASFRPGAATVTDGGNGLTYTNLLDAMVDAIYAALEKAGAPGVKVVVSESGWPSAGGFAASVDNARTYNQGVIDHARQGTPRKPGVLETYVFAMFNENQKTGDEIERHFGLFNPDKSPVYPITFPN